MSIDMRKYPGVKPRKRPMGVAEPLAVAEYERRGFDVIPQSAQHFFDYTVNGIRVEVKLSRETNFRGCFTGAQFNDRRQLTMRCDVVHVVCIEKDGAVWHCIVPSPALDGLLQRDQYSFCPHLPQYAPYREAWKHIGGVSA